MLKFRQLLEITVSGVAAFRVDQDQFSHAWHCRDFFQPGVAGVAQVKRSNLGSSRSDMGRKV